MASWLDCWLPVCPCIYAALPAQRRFMALHHSFAGMPVEVFDSLLQAVGHAAAPFLFCNAIFLVTMQLFLVTMQSCHLADSSLSLMQMIFHSRPIAIVLLVDMVALLMYNFSGMCVTGTTTRQSLGCCLFAVSNSMHDIA